MRKIVTRFRIIGLGIALLVLILVAIRAFFFFPNSAYRKFMEQPPNWSYTRSYCAGFVAAQRDWLADQSVINIFGAMDWLIQDRKTGLTILTFGCARTPAVEGFCDGYDQVIETYVRWWGFPKNSRKRWEPILLNPDAYFDNRSRTEKPQTLLLGGGPVSVHGMSLWLREVRNNDNKLIDYKLTCEDENLPCGIYECMIWPMIPVAGTLEVFTGPEGSDLLVVRGFNQGGNRPATFVFDLRYGYWTELERDP
jgi:hypothetical protein